MKQFYLDVWGLLPNTLEYESKRNEAYRKLRKESEEKWIQNQATLEANQDTIEFFLIGIPECFESHEVYNILWYF